MRLTVCVLVLTATSVLSAQQPAPPQTAPAPEDPIKTIVSRLDLEKYKATIKGLTQFGDRRQGTARNRAALDWIEAQLKSYGCTNTERVTYTYTPRTGQRGEAPEGGERAGGAGAGARGAGAGRGQADPTQGQGGSRIRGNRARRPVNSSAEAQPDLKLRELNTEQTPAEPGPRQDVTSTKVGTTRPREMDIVGGHMDGIGWGE